MRLIDADSLIKALDNSLFYSDSIPFVEEEPTVDAVQVVRCKDCCYFHSNNENQTYCNAQDGLSDPKENNFCSYGERRETDGMD